MRFVQMLLIILCGMGFWVLSLNYAAGNVCIAKGSCIIIYGVLFIEWIFVFYRIQHGPVLTIKSGALYVLYALVVPGYCLYMEELTWNTSLESMSFHKFFLNYVLIVSLSFILIVMFCSQVVAYIVIAGLCYLYGIVNHYVLVFKGCPPLFSDLLVANTAITVAGQYKFELSDSIIYGFMMLLGIITILLYFPLKKISIKKRRSRMFTFTAGLICLAVWLFAIFNWNLEALGVLTDSWNPVVSFYENGAPVTLLQSAQNMKIHKPDKYSANAAKQILGEIEKKDEHSMKNEQSPTVIVIMNESFSDINVLGDFASDEYLSKWNNNQSYIMKGYTYCSVLGGGTCNSEFEFLTGNSMANIKAGIYPYMVYNLTECYNLAEVFKKRGYETVAMHSYFAENWNRSKVYADFGFDKFISNEDLENQRYISWAGSDEYDYEQIINIYEEREKPLFLFNITMQNHGGYDVALSDDVERVSVEEQYKAYDDLINYLTLIRESDKAFANLLNYFSNKSEPVVICMFGDHQPILDGEFTNSIYSPNGLEEEQKQYMTPYMIWSNFEVQKEAQIKDMSINYLGANLLELIGIHTEYSEYLLELEKEIPIINIKGYQTKDGVWHRNDEEKEEVSGYKIVQYYEMFEKK